MRVLFAGGGTGGHLYPGLAIARALVRLDPRVEPFFVGARRGIERDVLPTTEFPHELLELHPLYRSRPWENWKTIAGAVSAWRRLGTLVREDRPRCVVGTGGYAAGLALAHAAAHGIPTVVQEQNSFPGLTVRALARFARQIHLGFPEAAKYLHPRPAALVADSGNPIEPPPATVDKGAARESWNFSGDAFPVLLVYGGSQGARAINDVVHRWLASFGASNPLPVNVIWGTGRREFEKHQMLESERVRVRPYLSPMAQAYAASDLAVSRAGAMATAELCAWGIPSIVIPLPTAAADHQTANARALQAAGAAVMLPQRDLTTDTLDAAVNSLILDRESLERHAAAARARARPGAAAKIAGDILQLMRTESE
jgi:UDP-N-acetylglucosamine--N-acetylmuramyl-(pentapeptide) pyrophosphoryl-undecaprenol N-acetylglucosamine transferase